MRFGDRKPTKVIYKSNQVPKRLFDEDRLIITDVKSKHKLPLTMD